MTRIAAALSTLGDAPGAAREVAERVRDGLDGRSADLALLFLTPDHLQAAVIVADVVREVLGPRRLLGCVAQGVIAADRELEHGPGVSLWAASLPGASVVPFHLEAGEDGTIEGLPDLDGAALLCLLVDPFGFPADRLLDELDLAYPGLPLVGGIAVGAGRPGAQALLLDDESHDRGALGVAVGNVAVTAVVSQGCAPLGRDLVVTGAEGNVVLELAGRPALERLREVVSGLAPRERALAGRGLLAGLVIDENKPDYGRGDYLMRGVLGADEERGALAVGERVRVGQTLRFHARDAESADEDLALALGQALGPARGEPAGALLFTCNGRGTHMFPEPDHDARAVSAALGGAAVAGFFCGGEIGPVGGRAFLHGFTATLALFHETPM